MKISWDSTALQPVTEELEVRAPALPAVPSMEERLRHMLTHMGEQWSEAHAAAAMNAFVITPGDDWIDYEVWIEQMRYNDYHNRPQPSRGGSFVGHGTHPARRALQQRQ